MGNLKQQEKMEAHFNAIDLIDDQIAKFEDAMEYLKKNNNLIQRKIFNLRGEQSSIDEIAELESEIELFYEIIIELENRITFHEYKKGLIEDEIHEL